MGYRSGHSVDGVNIAAGAAKGTGPRPGSPVKKRYEELSGELLLEENIFFAPGRATHAGSYGTHVKLQLGDGPAEGIAVHSQLVCGLTVIAVVLFEHSKDESLSEFAHCF